MNAGPYLGIPLYTTEEDHPWYRTNGPVPLIAAAAVSPHHGYHYAIHSGGEFKCWEDIRFLRRLDLNTFEPGEYYVVSDILSDLSRPPAIMKCVSSTEKVEHRPHRRSITFGMDKKESPHSPTSGDAEPSLPNGFSYTLSSTDGVVVASAFLPVVLHRSDDGIWSADWDYENLLSMESHMRVTRVGTVKWRGWHGNQGADGSPHAGVPVNERSAVEKCLEPFHCVPVWCDTRIFGEMYNGFCKGVLWPIFHNVSSVYAGEGSVQGGATTSSTANNSSVPSVSSVSNVKRNESSLWGGSSTGTLSSGGEIGESDDYNHDDVAGGFVHGDGCGRQAELWAAYTDINRQFANTIVQVFNEKDLIWVHGFHLLVLPSYLTRRIPVAKIGLFMHTPFPSSEIFRTLWCREDLLRGMLNADQVGFHLYEYARHFLTCCRRLLGLNYGMVRDSYGGHNMAIESHGRTVTVTSIHAGIEPPVLQQFLAHPSTAETVASIRSQFTGKVVLVGIDRLESLKGIPLKMLGLERFLSRRPEWVGRVVLIQVGISAYERGDDYFRTKREVLAMTESINRRWPQTIQFRECAESEMRLSQRIALLRSADMVLNTSLRDGLNRLPLEFTMAHQDATQAHHGFTFQGDRRKRGTCILSEFSSATRVMRGAIHVNPWKISEIAYALDRALNMDDGERIKRLQFGCEYVSRVTTQRWALAVLLDLKGVPKSDTAQYSGAGLGLGFRLLGMDRGFHSLDINAVCRGYRRGKTRLIMLDYGGTIVDDAPDKDKFQRYQLEKKLKPENAPAMGLVAALKELCSDPRNTVFVVSGKERQALSRILGRIPNLGLAAEHGFFYSWPNKDVTRRRWKNMLPDTDRSWRALALSIMEVYTSRTHGSYIEETEMKVVWQYRDADPEFGYLQSKELEDHLQGVLKNFAVDILRGGGSHSGYIEVRPTGVDKGSFLIHVLKAMAKKSSEGSGHGQLEFALALGDDHCDEPMLATMHECGMRAQGRDSEMRRSSVIVNINESLIENINELFDDSDYSYFSPEMKTFTCTVGKKPSAAANYLNDVGEVQELLSSLTKMTTLDNRFHSSINLSTPETTNVPIKELDYAMAFKSLQLKKNNETVSAGVTRSTSMNTFSKRNNFTSLTKMTGTDVAMSSSLSSGVFQQQDSDVSQSIREYLHKIDDEDDDSEDEAVFF